MLRRLAPVAGALIALLVLPAAASAVAPNPNPWLTKRFLNIAHQGGEDEAPSNTLFAFRSAMRERGADMLELDVNLSADDPMTPENDAELMVIHDDTWTRTSCTAALCPGPTSSTEPGRPASEVNDMTVAQLQALDAGYWFRPDTYSHDYSAAYPYRGIATGAVPPPAGYAATDFRIPTLREVLDAFPSTPINIEIKMIKTGPPTGPFTDDAVASIPVAHALAALLDEPQYASRTDIIVVSFSDPLIDEFHAQDDLPQVALAPGLLDTAFYVVSGLQPSPDVAAFQVPPAQSPLTGIPETILNDRGAHAQGYAVHVWPNGDEPDGEASYDRLIKLGIDGYMSSQPSRLHRFLCANEIPRPDGTDRCANVPAAKKKCKKGKRLKKGKCVKKKKKRKKGKKKRR